MKWNYMLAVALAITGVPTNYDDANKSRVVQLKAKNRVRIHSVSIEIFSSDKKMWIHQSTNFVVASCVLACVCVVSVCVWSRRNEHILYRNLAWASIKMKFHTTDSISLACSRCCRRTYRIFSPTTNRTATYGNYYLLIGLQIKWNNIK